MSGGSYNYVCRDFEYLGEPPSTEPGGDFERLVKRAEELRPGSQGAVRLRGLFDLCVKMRSEASGLFDLMETIEWCDSGDRGLDDVMEAFERLESK